MLFAQGLKLDLRSLWTSLGLLGESLILPQFPHRAWWLWEARALACSLGPCSVTAEELAWAGCLGGEGQWWELVTEPDQRGPDSPPWGSGTVGRASLSFPSCKMGVGPFTSKGRAWRAVIMQGCVKPWEPKDGAAWGSWQNGQGF